MKLAVFGASGATGRHLVRLASAAGTTVSVLVRAKAATTGIHGAKMLVIGDATDPADAAATLKGADAVAICLGITRRSRSPFAPLVSPPDLTSRATAAILTAMQAEGVRRVIYVSAFGAGDSWEKIPWWGRAFIRISQVRHSMADHTRSEERLAASGTQWTALRPMFLDDKSSAHPARRMQEGDSLFARVSRESLARTILEMLPDSSTHDRIIPLVGAAEKG
jgi:uncharacterized protein YbjT (DUF2867 family)